MRYYQLGCWLLLLSCCLVGCYKEEVVFEAIPDDKLELPLILALDDQLCFFDAASNSLRYPIENDSIVDFRPHVRFQNYAQLALDNKTLENNTINSFGTVRIGETYRIIVTIQGVSKTLYLSFTTLPMMRVVTPNAIVNEPKCLARLTINYTDQNKPVQTSFIGIEVRGNISQSNPKKSYSFTFLNSLNTRDKAARGVFDWEEKEAWILDAAYSDRSRLRNRLSFALWKDMNPTQHAYIRGNYVELYLNNTCLGLYSLNEQLNSEHLSLTHPEAVLYKAKEWGGATSFNYLSGTPPSRSFWEGWEQKHPDPSAYIYWQPLYDLRYWAIRSTNDDFIRKAADEVDLPTLMDYYIFIHLIGASDNYGKNLYWMQKSANDPFVLIPWDMDNSWGNGGLSTSYLPTGNSIYNRLLVLNPDNFRGRLKARWQVLRTTLASANAIDVRLQQAFQALSRTTVLPIENSIWGQNLDWANEEVYMKSWMQYRLVFLDDHFNNL
ncbi:MAG: CotH kinase family protein [Aureispira sp.]